MASAQGGRTWDRSPVAHHDLRALLPLHLGAQWAFGGGGLCSLGVAPCSRHLLKEHHEAPACRPPIGTLEAGGVARLHLTSLMEPAARGPGTLQFRATTAAGIGTQGHLALKSELSLPRHHQCPHTGASPPLWGYLPWQPGLGLLVQADAFKADPAVLSGPRQGQPTSGGTFAVAEYLAPCGAPTGHTAACHFHVLGAESAEAQPVSP